MIAALYVETDGAYFGLGGVEPWDEAKDARRYTGPPSNSETLKLLLHKKCMENFRCLLFLYLLEISYKPICA